MKLEKIDQIFKDTAYIHAGGTDEELQVAKYFQDECAKLGLEAVIESFPIQMADIEEASLVIDGKEIKCEAYRNCGSGEVEAEIYYLRNVEDAYSLKQCKGKIVLFDGYLRRWSYMDMLAAGAVGFITYDGNVHFPDYDIDQREFREIVAEGNEKILGVHINVRDAIAIVRNGMKTAKIVIKQNEYVGESRNVVLDLPGETDEYIALTAHYDSVPLSHGAYDNMSGSVALLGLAETYMNKPHRRGLRFIWTGSEERGLYGSKAYVRDHEDALKDIDLCVNIDMIGCVMGGFIGVCTTEEKAVHYLEYFANEVGFQVKASQGVYSSDSTPFADKGVPAISFARISPGGCSAIHCSHDCLDIMSAQQMSDDIDFIDAFLDRMANAKQMPVTKIMPDNMKEELDKYLLRKRPEKK